LRLLRKGVYDVYAVIEPVTTVTLGDQNAALLAFGNQRVEAASESAGAPVVARANWHPRWEGMVDGERVETDRLTNGYMTITPAAPVSSAELVYAVQPLDWAARALSLIGVVGLCWLLVQTGGQIPGIGAGMLNRRARRGSSSVSGIDA
jgi:hypothetical protein